LSSSQSPQPPESEPSSPVAEGASFAAAHPALQRALAARAYTTPTAVQLAVLGADARDRDLLVSAQTGSGKTVAFGLAVARTLLGDAERMPRAGAPRALIVTPTRELAQQVSRELTWLLADAGARVTTCVGGMDPRRESHALAAGQHVVVGTPGRLCDHLERGVLVLAQAEVVVLDEADEMLDMGFRDDLERLLQAAPTERRTLLFSATIPKDIAALAKRYQKNALRLATAAPEDRHQDIEYRAVEIVPRERDLAVVNVLRFHDAPGALVFCATRDGVTRLAANLHERGFAVAALSGEMSQRERNQALQALRDGRARVCVATDVAARGLDLPDLGLVIHADIPQNAQVLVHRSGRTGRAGKQGVAIVLVPERARGHVARMLAQAHVEVSWRPAPSPQEIRARDRLQLVGEVGALAEGISDDDRSVATALLMNKPAEELVAALVRLRREARPEPEELTPVMRAPAPPPRHARPMQGPHSSQRDHAPHASQRDHAPPQANDRRPSSSAPPLPATGPGSTWFTINVGRSKNADPKWLIPLLCRRGAITKRAIGKIQILQRETRVEIGNDFVDAFAIALRRPDDQDRNIHIERLDGSP
jgi:ATP-dependent RNA helicase DeaD